MTYGLSEEYPVIHTFGSEYNPFDIELKNNLNIDSKGYTYLYNYITINHIFFNQIPSFVGVIELSLEWCWAEASSKRIKRHRDKRDIFPMDSQKHLVVQIISDNNSFQ